MRLNKYISHTGLTSRRKADELIFEGKVSVNGKVVMEPGFQVNLSNDQVEVDHKTVALESENVYIMLNKPIRYITSVKDQFDRPSVLDLVKVPQRVYPVGRLDYDSQGLLLLTNDGEMTYALTHPKHDIEKTYHVKVKGTVEDSVIDKLTKGIYIDSQRTKPCRIKRIDETHQKTELQVTISEGRNRQIRKMFEHFHLRVTFLQRITIGNLHLGELGIGQWRYLTEEEVQNLRRLL
jgi:23S rRNA pseudouridine2605 synthase